MSEIALRMEKLGKRYAVQRVQTNFVRVFHALTRCALGRSRGAAPADEPNQFWALKDVCLEAKRGEVIGIIGRNGAGKSTLLKILSRITEPTAGRAEIYGRVGSLLEVGSGFHPDLTGRENIFLNGAILGMSRAEIRQKFAEIVEFAEVGKFIDTCVKHYSSGMYMRLAFSVAAHLETEILFCDEVLAVGDAAFQQKCLGKMDDVTRSGRTILFVSHSIDAIKALCHRAVWLECGEVRSMGPAGEIADAYLAEVLGKDVRGAQFAEDGCLPIQLVAAELVPAPRGAPADTELQLEYVVRGRCDGVMLCIEVRNSHGVSVFYANDRQLQDPAKRRLGRHRCCLKIPFSLLAPDRYEIAFGLWEPGHPATQFPEVRLTHLRDAEPQRPDVRCLATHGVTWPSVLYVPAAWDAAPSPGLCGDLR